MTWSVKRDVGASRAPDQPSAELPGADHTALLAALPLLTSVAYDIDQVDIVTYESASLDELKSGLYPTAAALLGRCKEVLRELAPQVFLAETPELYRAPDSLRRKAQDAEQLCFIAALELAQLEDVLSSQAHSSQKQLLFICDRTLRRAKKAMDAVEETLRSLLKQGDAERTSHDLERSLIVREEYARLLGSANFVEPESEGEMTAVIERLRDSLIALMEGPAYPLARLKDRFIFRDLRERLTRWLAQADMHREGGVHLISDFSATVQMLRLVSQRSELRRHDASQLEQALFHLRRGLGFSLEGSALAPLLTLEGYPEARFSELLKSDPKQAYLVLSDLQKHAKGHRPRPDVSLVWETDPVETREVAL